jgi:hypothetical protein
MARDTPDPAPTALTAAEMTDMILDRINELDWAIAQATDPKELRNLMSQRLDGYDILTALSRRP